MTALVLLIGVTVTVAVMALYAVVCVTVAFAASLGLLILNGTARAGEVVADWIDEAGDAVAACFRRAR